jgi:hypothetical protein
MHLERNSKSLRAQQLLVTDKRSATRNRLGHRKQSVCRAVVRAGPVPSGNHACQKCELRTSQMTKSRSFISVLSEVQYLLFCLSDSLLPLLTHTPDCSVFGRRGKQCSIKVFSEWGGTGLVPARSTNRAL